MLPRCPALARTSGAWSTHSDQCAHTQGPAQDCRRAAQSQCQDRNSLTAMPEDPKSKKTVVKKEGKPEGAAAIEAPKAATTDPKSAKPAKKTDATEPAKAGEGAPASPAAAPVAPTAAELL